MLDIIVTYSNIRLAFQNNMTSANWSTYLGKNPKLSLFSGNTIAMCYNEAGSSHFNQRTGIFFDINIKVADPNDNDSIVPGTYYYPQVDIDIKKYGDANFGKIYGAADHGTYSEQLLIRGGKASDIFVPGSVTPRYKSQITYTADGYLVGAGNHDAAGDNNTFYSGFTVLVNNVANSENNPNGGIDLTYYGYAGAYNNSLDTNLLTASSPLNHQLVATSGEGGAIATTNRGNSAGKLAQGDKISSPLIDTVFDKSVLDARLDAANISYVDCGVVKVFNKGSVPASVAAWNDANPDMQLIHIPNEPTAPGETAPVYPYVYEFTLKCPNANESAFRATALRLLSMQRPISSPFSMKTAIPCSMMTATPYTRRNS